MTPPTNTPAVAPAACPTCGAAMATPSPLCPACGSYHWDASIPLVGDRFFFLDTVTALGIAVVAMYGLVALMGVLVDGRPVFLPWQMGAGLLAGLFLLFGLVSLVVFQNRVDVSYAVGPAGIVQTAGAKVRKVNRVVLVLALLSGKGGAIGSGLLAQSRETTHIEWDEVRGVWYHPGRGVVEVRDNLFRMTRLFCPPSLYPAVAALVQAQVAAHPAPVHHTDHGAAWRTAGWIVAALLAAVLVPAWQEDLVLWGFGAALLISAARVAAGGMARLLAAAALLVVAAAGAQVLAAAMERTDFYGLFSVRGYERDTEYLAITAAGLAALGGLAVWRAVRPGR